MDKDIKITIKPTPKEMAELLWDMYADEQAEMLHELHKLAGSDHTVMLQFLNVRQHCEERVKTDASDKSLECFLSLFSSAYKYAQASS